MPKISIIITTHRRSNFLRRAIGSIRAQSENDLQIIVVSDVHCPDTQRVVLELLEHRDIFIQRNGDCGPAESRNIGLRVAEGRHIVFLDDDDAFTELFLKDAGPHLDDSCIIYTNYHVVFETYDGLHAKPFAAEARDLGAHPPLDLLVKNFIPQHCLVYPAAIVKQCRVDPSLELNEDWDFILQAAALAELKHVAIDGPIIYTRDNTDNRGRGQSDRLESVYRRIYLRYPAPTLAIQQARDHLMARAVPVAA